MLTTKHLLGVLKPFLPNHDGTFPPAITTGLPIFLTALYLINLYVGGRLFDAIALYPHAPLELDLNRVSMYPLAHTGLIHLVFNIFALVGPMAKFEASHGTVHTGVVLNVLATITALLYCVIAGVLLPEARVVGASAWWFSFAAFFAKKESASRPHIHLVSNFAVPTVFSPLVPLVVITVLVPSGASFIGHGCGLVAGYLLGFGYLKFMIPPTKVIEWIEAKVDVVINLIPSQIKYYREIDVRPIRDDGNNYSSIFGGLVLPFSEPSLAGFAGEGRALGV